MSDEKRILIGERIKEIKELNDQENELLNHRLTWMGLTQGLLLNGFILAINTYTGIAGKKPISHLLILFILCGAGVFLSLCLHHSLKMGHDTLNKLKERYKKLLEELRDMNGSEFYNFPLAVGLFCNLPDDIDGKMCEKENNIVQSRLAPIIFIVFWVFLLLVSFLCWKGI
jgi:hypothetical protein